MTRPLALLAAFLLTALSARAQSWKPVEGHPMTRWAKDVSPENAWPEYPRPTLVRDRWLSLNGLWDCVISKGAAAPDVDARAPKILVPFPPESALSGLGRIVQPDETLRYRRTFSIPPDWKGDRVLLHFGAVDWSATVEVNGHPVGAHEGGYDPFTLEITDALVPGTNTLVVRVTDPTDSGGQPRGKQWLKPHAIWYTPTSGIWQTVWLEPVAKAGYVKSVSFAPSIAGSYVDTTVTVDGPVGSEWCVVEIHEGGKLLTRNQAGSGAPARIEIPNPRLWTPDHPFLYDVTIMVRQGDVNYDTVKTYFAFREITVAKDERGEHGVNRLCLNGEPLFQFGPLDQGFWPDGLYTPPTDEAMRADIEAVKRMGGNMLRKHVKVENDRFYSWCDKLGVMVWQDMPSPFFAEDDAKSETSPALSAAWKANFEREWANIMKALAPHPCIVMWVPFNEGWGQSDLDWCRKVVQDTRKADPTRLVDNASGWTDMNLGDVSDVHVYPGPGVPPAEPSRAGVLGEFGGLGLPVDGHTWVAKDNWGYVSFKNQRELTDAYVELLRRMPVLIGQGLAAAVYTQTTDVEVECNGWLTYDREVWKIDPARASQAARALYAPPPRVQTVLTHAGEGPSASWRYTTSRPADTWFEPGFDDSAWLTGTAGFGSAGTPGATVNTRWTTTDIWIRRDFDLAEKPALPHLAIHHDEDAEVYINGVLVATLPGFTTGYRAVPLSEQAAQALHAGKNSLAAHCHQTTGGQYIDCGILDVR
jgi:hypothetical protein